MPDAGRLRTMSPRAPLTLVMSEGHARIDTHDLADDVPTTRRFSRSLHGVAAAFPGDPQYTNAITRFGRSLHWIHTLSFVVLFLSFGCAIGLLIRALRLWSST